LQRHIIVNNFLPVAKLVEHVMEISLDEEERTWLRALEGLLRRTINSARAAQS